MVKIDKITFNSGGLAGFMVEDDDNRRYVGLHSFAHGEDALVSIANQIDSEDLRLLKGQFHPSIAILPNPQPIPQRVKDIFFSTYKSFGVPSIVVGNDCIAYVIN